MTQKVQEKARIGGAQGTLGTFGGVFTPSVLTILGIILFMRLGYVVGEAGLRKAFLLIALANVISLLTTFSLSAIATNLNVKGGGDYYLISRTLGVEFGGAIGIVLYLAQSVSIAFYCIGFGEAVAAMIPGSSPWLPQTIAASAAAFLFVFAWLGADWATKFQYVVMAALVASLCSFFAGGIGSFDAGVLSENWAADGGSATGFWILFAIFFPAVTGFTQGVSMSGDLKDPGRSLPLGTFLAVGISVIVYFGAALVFGGSLDSAELRRDYGAMGRVSLVPWLVSTGVIAATLSSAMASFLGAPRILQSMARDRIFPFLSPFAAGAGSAENPRRAVLLSAGIAFVTIALGSLDMIAPVVSMFFLISYGLINYATFYEARTHSPSFRPRFRWFSPRLSLVGAIGCLGAMLAIDLASGLAAVAVIVAIHQYLKFSAGPARWADSRRAYHFQRLREHLFDIAGEPEHARNWRPRLLVFSNDSDRRDRLLHFATWIEAGSGLTTAVQIVEGEGAVAARDREEAQKILDDRIAAGGLDVFGRVITARNVLDGSRVLIQSYGIGPVRANMVLVNWLEQVSGSAAATGEERYGRYLRTALRLGCNVVVLDARADEWEAMKKIPPADRRIDVWWSGDATSRLMLLLAYLMTRHGEWEGARIRLLTLGGSAERGETSESLRDMLEEARIDAEPEVVAHVDAGTIEERSADAALVFLPLRIRRYQPVDPFDERFDGLFESLPVVAVVLAVEDIPLDAEPEEGEVGENALVLDKAADASLKAEKAEKDALHAASRVAAAMRDLHEKADGATGEEGREEAEKTVLEAKELAEKASRRAARDRAKADGAAEAADDLTTRHGKRERKGNGSSPEEHH
jgi:amino acid transporter